MSAIKEDITRLNDELFQENKKLRAQAEMDSEFIINLGKRLKEANEKIARLEAELNELRGMQPESDTSSGSSTGEIPGALYRAYARGTLRRDSIGD